MGIRVENQYREGLYLNIDRIIKKLLVKVPKEHLVGLNSIIIVKQVTHKCNKNSGGIYWPKGGRDPARIEIAVDKIYKGMPRFLHFLPFIAKFMLASVLYHEIGHHYQCSTHNLKKKEWESFAIKYKKEMLKKTFFWWRLLLLPFSHLVYWLNNKAQVKINSGKQNHKEHHH